MEEWPRQDRAALVAAVLVMLAELASVTRDSAKKGGEKKKANRVMGTWRSIHTLSNELLKPRSLLAL